MNVQEKAKQIEIAAAAIANARGMRRGVPEILNILEMLPAHLRDEVMEDARAALEATWFQAEDLFEEGPSIKDKSTSAEDLLKALEASVELQSHYAKLLNMYDGGLRIGFANAAAWLARLRELKQIGDTPTGPSKDGSAVVDAVTYLQSQEYRATAIEAPFRADGGAASNQSKGGGK